MTWASDAACRGMDVAVFFPDTNTGIAQAKAICKRCPVIDDCLEDALATPRDDDIGIRAGTTQSKRRRIREERAQAADVPLDLDAYEPIPLRWDRQTRRYLQETT